MEVLPTCMFMCHVHMPGGALEARTLDSVKLELYVGGYKLLKPSNKSSKCY